MPMETALLLLLAIAPELVIYLTPTEPHLGLPSLLLAIPDMNMQRDSSMVCTFCSLSQCYKILLNNHGKYTHKIERERGTCKKKNLARINFRL